MNLSDQFNSYVWYTVTELPYCQVLLLLYLNSLAVILERCTRQYLETILRVHNKVTTHVIKHDGVSAVPLWKPAP